jgi:hypothetical protein
LLPEGAALSERRRRSDRQPRREAPPAAAPTILSEGDAVKLLDRLLRQSGRRALVVLCVRPRLLPNETLKPGELAHAAQVMRRQIRAEDHVGTLGDEGIVTILRDAEAASARAVAHRLTGDLARASGPVGRSWRVGVAVWPGGGRDARELIQAAIDNA